MKNRYSFIFFIFSASVMLASGCTEKYQLSDIPQSSDNICFAPGVRSFDVTDQTKGVAHSETKASGTEAVEFDTSSNFFVSAWEGATSFIPAYTKVSYVSDSRGYNRWTTVDSEGEVKDYKWKSGADEMTFYAYSNLPSETYATVSNTAYDKQTLVYTEPASSSDQKDILLGYFQGAGSETKGTASIEFYHPLTRVEFVGGLVEGVTVNSITLKGVYSGGTATMTPESMASTGDKFTWVPASGESSTMDITRTVSATVSGEALCDPIYLVPQDMGDSPVTIVVNLTVDGKTFDVETALGNGTVWAQGVTNVYTVNYDVGAYVKFSAPTERSVMVTAKTIPEYGLPNPESVHFEYSYDRLTWNQLDLDKSVEFGGSKGDIYFRGSNPGGPQGYGFSTNTDSWVPANVTVSGNLMALAYKNLESTEIGENAFQYLFQDYKHLVDASNLEFPGGTAPKYGYYAFFKSCKNLRYPPSLPATKILDHAYSYMFARCTSLTTAPDLPAMQLGKSAYANMFRFCDSLAEAPELPAEELSDACYFAMFEDTRLIKAPELPALKLYYQCYELMFSGCKALTEAPELPATVLGRYCYDGMFQNCTELKIAPELPATELVQNCYSEMFKGCAKLNYVKIGATKLASDYYSCAIDWLQGVSDSGTLVHKSGVDLAALGIVVPEGWTAVAE